jgi:hypothetical protein
VLHLLKGNGNGNGNGHGYGYGYGNGNAGYGHGGYGHGYGHGYGTGNGYKLDNPALAMLRHIFSQTVLPKEKQDESNQDRQHPDRTTDGAPLGAGKRHDHHAATEGA